MAILVFHAANFAVWLFWFSGSQNEHLVHTASVLGPIILGKYICYRDDNSAKKCRNFVKECNTAIFDCVAYTYEETMTS